MKKRSSSQKSQKAIVKTKGTRERVTIGMDLGDKTSRYCYAKQRGRASERGKSRLPKLGWTTRDGAVLGPPYGAFACFFGLRPWPLSSAPNQAWWRD
jgi:hypothetical protein